MNQRHKIGLQGELRVVEILAGSEHPNVIKESQLPYDIVWEGIKINVKATTITVRGSSGACSFNIRMTGHHSDIILVFIAFLDGQEYFWVDKYKNGIKSYYKLSDSIPASELADKVREASKKGVPTIDKPLRTYKVINVSNNSYDRIKQVRDALKQQNNIKSLSVRGTVMEGIKLLERKVGK